MAVEAHGEVWVIENYFQRSPNWGVMMDIPSVEGMPFYDEETYIPSEEARRKQADAYGAYFENLRRGTKLGEE